MAIHRYLEKFDRLELTLIKQKLRATQLLISADRISMDITNTIEELKKRPEFIDNVGMILIHNGVVRNWSRKDRTAVTALEVTPDLEN